MSHTVTHETYIAKRAQESPALGEVYQVLIAAANASAELSLLIGLRSLAGATSATVGRNTDGDQQKELDVRAQEIFIRHISAAPVAKIASEEAEDWLLLDAKKPLAVAFDPLDGSSNIDSNMSIGTIFSIRPAAGASDPFAGPGSGQIAAGFVV
jgi:fructose-1,6-bisphosphatase I